MFIPRTRLLRLLNTSLLLVIALLAAFWGGWAWNRRAVAKPGEDADEAMLAEASRLPVRVLREVSVGRVGVRPVSFDDRQRLPPSARENWSQHGVEPREWDWLPASPGMDMAETPRDYVLLFSLPGVRPEDIRLTVSNHVITVQATVRDAGGGMVGGLLRRVQLPRPTIESAPVASVFSNGILRVCVGK